MDIRNAVRACCALLAVTSVQAYGQANYTVVDLGTLGGTRTVGFDLNAYGQVTGFSTLADGRGTAIFWDGASLRDIGPGGWSSIGRALNDAGQVILDPDYRWTAGTLERITAPPAWATYPEAINSSGVVVGSMHLLSPSEAHAMRWDGGAPQDLGTLGGNYSGASAINDTGQIAGSAQPTPPSSFHPVIWTNGEIRDLGLPPGAFMAHLDQINESGQAAGLAWYPGYGMAIRWNGTKLEELGYGDGVASQELELNDAGFVAGMIWNEDARGSRWSTAAIWEPGTTAPTLLMPGQPSVAYDVDAAGTAVGGTASYDATTGRAFVWNGRLRLLDEAFDPADPAAGRVTLTNGVKINAAGQVMALGRHADSPGVQRTFVLTPRIPRFAFGGFMRPIDSSGTNVVKAGSAVPVKFSLGGYRGPDVFAAGFPRVVPCGEPASAIGVPADTAGRSGLQYEPASDTYTLVWKTDKAWASTCQRLEVAFVDETPVRAAEFQLR